MASNEGRVQSNLHQQDLSKLDVTKLSALSPEVISRQATINIGTIGHVAHGKSTVVKAISGVQTVRFKNELERNITIKLERVSDSLIRMFCERSEEIAEDIFQGKITKRKQNQPTLPEPEEPPAKKRKKKTQELEEFNIENILDFKFENGVEYFFIKWRGWPDSDNTWEPIENLDKCHDILRSFLFHQEEKHCKSFEKLKGELSFDNLLSEENLVKRLVDFEEFPLLTLKDKLLLKLLSLTTLTLKEECHVAKLVQETRDILQMYVSARKRCRQLMGLKQWEEFLNQVDKCKRLVVENEFDLCGPPENFTYINECIPGVGVVIPTEPPIGCDCTACNCRSKACCGMQAGLFAYTIKKRLRVASGTPIFECNKACKCSDNCNNRVVQKGRNIKLTIFRTNNGCGWGVKTSQKIYQGQFICQYVGEVITFEEAEKRGREYDANGLTYLFDLDFNSAENPYTIDACNLGNVSHFINHSCEPNLGVWAVWADCLDPNLPMLALFATRNIEAGEEICFDYLHRTEEPTSPNKVPHEVSDPDSNLPDGRFESASEGNVASSPASPGKLRKEMHQNNSLRKQTECKCGAVKCRKYIF